MFKEAENTLISLPYSLHVVKDDSSIWSHASENKNDLLGDVKDLKFFIDKDTKIYYRENNEVFYEDLNKDSLKTIKNKLSKKESGLN